MVIKIKHTKNIIVLCQLSIADLLVESVTWSQVSVHH